MEAELDWKAFEEMTAKAARQPPRIEKLAYRAPGTLSVPAQPRAEAAKSEAEPAPPPVADQSTMIAALEGQLRVAETTRAAEADRLIREGREAVEQARNQAERQSKAAIERAVREVGGALESFRREREEYFSRVEREVVELALAIAARILHREVLLDPMLLAGAVRVALDQLGETTGVRLKCPATEAARWRELLSSLPLPPEVIGDDAMTAGECVLEARIGTVDLGIKAQLGEIERGFFDLLGQRPVAGQILSSKQ